MATSPETDTPARLHAEFCYHLYQTLSREPRKKNRFQQIFPERFRVVTARRCE